MSLTQHAQSSLVVIRGRLMVAAPGEHCERISICSYVRKKVSSEKNVSNKYIFIVITPYHTLYSLSWTGPLDT